MATNKASSYFLRSIVAMCACVLVAGGIVRADSPPDSMVIRVSKNVAGYQAPYHYGSIQGAIDDLPSELTTPTVVLIYPGEYQEYVLLDRRNVSLVGIEPGAVSLSATGTTATLTISLPAGSAGDVSMIESISVSHDGSDGGVPLAICSISPLGDSLPDVVIRDCQISSTGGEAVEWSTGGTSIIADCDLAGVGRVIDSSSIPSGGQLLIRSSRLALTSSTNGQSAIAADETIDAREIVFSVENAGTHSSLTAFSGASAATVTVALGTVLDSMTWGDDIVFNNVDAGPNSNLNADYLDSLDSTQFLRADAADTATGDITFSGALLSPGTGTQSFKAGPGATAAGSRATAIGSYASAPNDNTVAIGRSSTVTSWNANAIGYNSTAAERSNAVGSNAHASGAQSVAIGEGADATSSRAVAVGFDTTSEVGSSIAVGYAASATNTNAIAVGSNSSGSGNRSLAFGDAAIAEGDYSIALGWGSHAVDDNSFALGQGVVTSSEFELKLGREMHHVHVPGDLGVGIVDPVEKLEIYNGAISIGADSYSSPSVQSGRAKLFVDEDANNSSVTAMWVMDSTGNVTQLSSHADPDMISSTLSRTIGESSFSDPSVDLPWSFHHANRVTGEAAIIDMSKLVQWVESEMQKGAGKNEKLVYRYKLPEEQVVSRQEWEIQSFLSAVERDLRAAPWVEVPLQSGNKIPSEAFEYVEEMELLEAEEAYTDYEVDLLSETVIEVQKMRLVLKEVPTGSRVKRLRESYKVENGRLYRQRTFEDVDMSRIHIPKLPAWVDLRLRDK